MSGARPPVPPGLRPVAGGGAGQGSPPVADEVAAVLREFGANRIALAAEVVRLRAALQDALFEVSRRAAAPLLVPAPPGPHPRRPGF